jgi:hypothetical protein
MFPSSDRSIVVFAISVDFCDVKVFGLRDSTSVDQGIGYDSIKRCLVVRANIGLVDVLPLHWLLFESWGLNT